MEAEILNRVIELQKQHQYAWRDKSEHDWLIGLIEEVTELSRALKGTHQHTPDSELMQIAAICLNWLEMRHERVIKEGQTVKLEGDVRPALAG